MTTITKNQNTNSVEGVKVKSIRERENEEFKNSLPKETLEKFNRLTSKYDNKKTEKEEENEMEIIVNETENVTVEIVNKKYDLYVSELKPYIDENQTLINDIYSKTVRMVFNFINMGNILTQCKDNLSKDDFAKIQKHFDLEERSVYRYIKLVKDERVSNLTIDELTSMLKPSMGKLVKMSKLEDDEFKLVLSGEDTPLLPDGSVDDEKENLFKDVLSDEDYKKLLSFTKIDIIGFFSKRIRELKTDNTDLISIITSNNMYSMEEKVAS